jgi:hypothetical protein
MNFLQPRVEAGVQTATGTAPHLTEQENLATNRPRDYFRGMVIIRFDDEETERKALDYLIGRVSFKTWANGELMLPQEALGHLAAQGISFHVKGPATYEHFLPPLRNPASTAV